MSTNIAVSVFLLTGCVLFILSVFLRAKTGGKYEIKIADLVLVLIPLVFWPIVTGKIQRFTL